MLDDCQLSSKWHALCTCPTWRPQMFTWASCVQREEKNLTVLKLFPLCLNICILEIIGEAWWRLWSVVGVNLIWQSKHILSYGWIPSPFVEKIRFFKIQPSPPLPAPLLQTYRTLSFRASFLLLTMLASNAHCPAWKCLPFYSAE